MDIKLANLIHQSYLKTLIYLNNLKEHNKILDFHINYSIFLFISFFILLSFLNLKIFVKYEEYLHL